MLARWLTELCPACGAVSAAGFCALCAAACARLPDGCPRCGLPQPVRSCPRAAGAWWLDRIVACHAYREPIKSHILALKYGGQRHLGRALGLLVAERIEPFRLDALVPVPLHATRWRERGYNQSIEIARPIARRYALPLLVRGVRRRRATGLQTGLGAKERLRNLAGAFAIGPRVLPGPNVCIVDDVVTTGATANALACALLDAGAHSVMVLAVARTLE